MTRSDIETSHPEFKMTCSIMRIGRSKLPSGDGNPITGKTFAWSSSNEVVGHARRPFLPMNLSQPPRRNVQSDGFR